MPTTKNKQVKKHNDITKPEIFVGLVGAVGTDLSVICSSLSKELKSVGYKPEIIRLSDVLIEFGQICDKLSNLKNIKNVPENERIERLMDAGDILRNTLNRGSAVSELALSAIKKRRSDNGCGIDDVCYGTAYIFNSLKHPDEINMLRELYGKSFILISVYSPRKQRLEKLTKLIAKSHHKAKNSTFESFADNLIKRDKTGETKNICLEGFGQNVRDAFPLADVFITEDRKNVDLKRFVELLFGHPFITPTTDEYSMFHAQAAALRSSDLSRQIGAVITTGDAEIVSTGCNEVPKAGGGQVWENTIERKKDYRDFQLGNDANTLMKHELMSEILIQLNKHNYFQEKKSEKEIASLAEEVFSKGEKGILKNSRIASIIEYGRIVHAEMSALMEAARRGQKVNSCTLYSTTFPCHMCSRHIIDAGIKRVVYIEPYPKSMAKQLYQRSICVDDDEADEADEDAVKFDPFVGVAPRKYFELFQMSKRKDNYGYKLDWKPETSQLRLFERFPNYLDNEVSYIDKFNKEAKENNLIKANK